MPLMTPEAYKESLRDGRTIYYRGKKVEDVTAHPTIGLAVDHAAIDYEMAHSSEDRDLALSIQRAEVGDVAAGGCEHEADGQDGPKPVHGVLPRVSRPSAG